MVYLGLAVPPVAAALLAWRFREEVRSDLIIRGQFDSIGWILGLPCLIGVVGDFHHWELPFWLAGFLSGVATVLLVRKPRGSW